MCLQRSFVLAYFWSHAWVQLHHTIGACFPPCTENLILKIGIKGLGEVDSLEGKRRKIQLSIYISISLLFILWHIAFTKKGTIIPSTLHGLIVWFCHPHMVRVLSPPLESSGPVGKKKKRTEKNDNITSSTGNYCWSLNILRPPSCYEAQRHAETMCRSWVQRSSGDPSLPTIKSPLPEPVFPEEIADLVEMRQSILLKWLNSRPTVFMSVIKWFYATTFVMVCYWVRLGYPA